MFLRMFLYRTQKYTFFFFKEKEKKNILIGDKNLTSLIKYQLDLLTYSCNLGHLSVVLPDDNNS